jgi:hypothetical protein
VSVRQQHAGGNNERCRLTNGVVVHVSCLYQQNRLSRTLINLLGVSARRLLGVNMGREHQRADADAKYYEQPT